MNLVDALQITRDAVAQVMGVDYMGAIDPDTQEPISNKAFSGLDSQALADIGKDVTGDDKIASLNNGLIAVIGRHIIEKRLYTSRIPSIYVESYDWGGFLERTRVGLGEIFDDPMYTKQFGENFAEIEHTYFGQPAYSKIFEEAKAIMVPMSTEREKLREAFTGYDKLNEFISAKESKIRSTINIALHAVEKMLIQCGIAISDIKNGSAVHLITEAVAAGVIEQIPVENDDPRNPTYEEVRLNPAFLAYAMMRMGEIREYLMEPSACFNDGTMPTWCDEDPTLVVLEDFKRACKVYVKANTFNPDEIGVGAMDSVTCWQAVLENVADSDPKKFDPTTLSSVYVAANAAGKIGQTTKYEKTGVLGLMFDKSAIGISLRRSKVTSNYTASADFWNTYFHELYDHIIDSSYSIVAFIAD